MNGANGSVIDSPIGKQEIDSEGSPVGVVRVDVDKSYAGVGGLLQDYINDSNQQAWDRIKAKIDYTYDMLDLALRPLEMETNLTKEIKARLGKGQKLLFKPNLVMPSSIDPQTHGPDTGSTTVTDWTFIAALMRWFHDKMDISYYRMCVGEAATAMSPTAGYYSMYHPDGNRVTTESVMEGKSGNFYGGWGFYFARKYLAESLGADATDDPMNGHEESVSGTTIPPGHVSDKLMLYDLNRIFDDPTKGRDIPVPNGINYDFITLHKAIIGGNPEDPDDMAAYPGAILINVPKLKVHNIALFTNIIKNLGIGLYPMQFARTGGHKWDYSNPHNRMPGMKSGIPHEVWVPELDFETGLPRRDEEGQYIVNKTGGITATMIDIIKAVVNQDIFMIHVVDGIEAINFDHTGTLMAKREPEGMVFAGLDPVAADLLCARYLFSNIPMEEALKTGVDDGAGGCFPQSVPIAKVDGKNIVTETDYDCPLSRDICFRKAEERGLGQRRYYVLGHDAVTDTPLGSVKGHLGSIENGKFTELITKTLFLDVFKMPWDMQKTVFSYMDAVDNLEGSSLKKTFLDAFDEDGDGVVTYEEFGKKGIWGTVLHSAGETISRIGSEHLGYLKRGFGRAPMLKTSDPSMNPDGHDMYKEFYMGSAILTAYRISQMDTEGDDPFLPGLTWGKGKWPSFALAQFFQMGVILFGAGFPNKIAFPSFYSAAFFYADHTQNESRYTGELRSEPNPEALDRYVSGVLNGQEKPLDFTLYVPAGYDNLSGSHVPNVEATSDPTRILTVSFKGGREVWPQ
jgi:hypothetical protein